MKCEELQSLSGAYLDSELDARTTAETQQHLAACPDCARAFAAEAKLEEQVAVGLKRGERTAALWERIEQSVVAAAEAESGARRATRSPLRMPGWREMLWPCPQAWAGLAAVWGVILVASFASHEPVRVTAARQAVPMTPEMRQMLWQQRQMLAELSGGTERALGGQARPATLQPRSERRKELSNT